MTKCEFDGCKTIAIYNIKGENKGRFCLKHKEPNMIDVKNKKCEFDGCQTEPSCNIKGENKVRFCSKHKDENMVNVKTKKCEFDQCETIPVYNIKGQKTARFCLKHKDENMVDIKTKFCEFDRCKTRPIYNIKGEEKGRFCLKHKEKNMVNIKDKSCEFNGCETRPIYNIKGQTKGRFCSTHKDENMVDVKSKLCDFDGCDKNPNYNIKGKKKGRFCLEHKEKNMVDVKNKRCEFDGCDTTPNYNIKEEKIPRFCLEHKEENMVDVRHNKCKFDNCIKRASYGLLGKTISSCSVHKQKGMIISPTRKCENCKKLGTHEYNRFRYCEVHKPEKSKNLGIDKCSVCGLDDILTNGKCDTCDQSIIQKRIHSKENRVGDLLTASGIKYTHDKILESKKCGEERPDFQIDCGTHFVYVEVDENQHSSYACECEQTRMINLVEQRGMPVRFIRYNPDLYEPLKGQRSLKLEQREKKLIEYTKWAMKHSPKDNGVFSDVLYLFYDDYDTTNQVWHALIKL